MSRLWHTNIHTESGKEDSILFEQNPQKYNPRRWGCTPCRWAHHIKDRWALPRHQAALLPRNSSFARLSGKKMRRWPFAICRCIVLFSGQKLYVQSNSQSLCLWQRKLQMFGFVWWMKIVQWHFTGIYFAPVWIRLNILSSQMGQYQRQTKKQSLSIWAQSRTVRYAMSEVMYTFTRTNWTYENL